MVVRAKGFTELNGAWAGPDGDAIGQEELDGAINRGAVSLGIERGNQLRRSLRSGNGQRPVEQPARFGAAEAMLPKVVLEAVNFDTGMCHVANVALFATLLQIFNAR